MLELNEGEKVERNGQYSTLELKQKTDVFFFVVVN